MKYRRTLQIAWSGFSSENTEVKLLVSACKAALTTFYHGKFSFISNNRKRMDIRQILGYLGRENSTSLYARSSLASRLYFPFWYATRRCFCSWVSQVRFVNHCSDNLDSTRCPCYVVCFGRSCINIHWINLHCILRFATYNEKYSQLSCLRVIRVMSFS